MPEMQYHEIAAGTAGGLIGSGAAAMSKKVSGSDLWCAVLVGMALGAFVPPYIAQHYEIPPFGAGLIGLVLGLCVLAIVPWIQRIGDKILAKGERKIDDTTGGGK